MSPYYAIPFIGLVPLPERFHLDEMSRLTYSLF
jgi:hypothetical protein